MTNPEEFLLTKTVTVGNVKNWMALKDADSKEKIINLINHRFRNRYINHVKEIKSGFLKMAISCLMIETFESFKKGKNDTKGKGAKFFENFFSTEEGYFPGFKDIHEDFYTNIRCGILHQAETKNMWRIWLEGSLLNTAQKIINADKFLLALEKSFENYLKILEEKSFDEQIWVNALKKLNHICDNCNASH
jgi:hypothetical protein